MKNNLRKFYLDVIMAITFFILFKPEFTSLTVHEIVGIAIGAVFIVHVLFNKKWVTTVTKKLFSNKVNGKTKFSYWLNVLLLVDMMVVLISGLLRSEVVFPNLRYDIGINWLPLHITASMISLVLVGIHVGLHWDWMKQMGKHMPKLAKFFTFKQPARKIVANTLLILGTLFLLIQLPKTVMLTSMIFSDEPLRSEEHRDQDVEGREHNERQFAEEGERDEFRDEHGQFSPIQLIGIIPIVIIHASIIGALAYYTHLLENRRKNRRLKLS